VSSPANRQNSGEVLALTEHSEGSCVKHEAATASPTPSALMAPSAQNHSSQVKHETTDVGDIPMTPSEHVENSHVKHECATSTDRSLSLNESSQPTLDVSDKRMPPSQHIQDMPVSTDVSNGGTPSACELFSALKLTPENDASTISESPSQRAPTQQVVSETPTERAPTQRSTSETPSEHAPSSRVKIGIKGQDKAAVLRRVSNYTSLREECDKIAPQGVAYAVEFRDRYCFVYVCVCVSLREECDKIAPQGVAYAFEFRDRCLFC
jgi:hypothetical protein